MLKLTATTASKVGFDVREVASSTWAEGALEVCERSRRLGDDGHERRRLCLEAGLSFDVTTSVTAGIRSFALVDRGSASALSVGSSESKTSVARPQLVVTYTPAPRLRTVWQRAARRRVTTTWSGSGWRTSRSPT